MLYTEFLQCVSVDLSRLAATMLGENQPWATSNVHALAVTMRFGCNTGKLSVEPDPERGLSLGHACMAKVLMPQLGGGLPGRGRRRRKRWLRKHAI